MEKFCSSPSLTQNSIDLEFEIQSTASPSNICFWSTVLVTISRLPLWIYTLSIHANETFPSLKPFVRPKIAIWSSNGKLFYFQRRRKKFGSTKFNSPHRMYMIVLPPRHDTRTQYEIEISNCWINSLNYDRKSLRKTTTTTTKWDEMEKDHLYGFCQSRNIVWISDRPNLAQKKITVAKMKYAASIEVEQSCREAVAAKKKTAPASTKLSFHKFIEISRVQIFIYTFSMLSVLMNFPESRR